jgi:hypothetical protein
MATILNRKLCADPKEGECGDFLVTTKYISKYEPKQDFGKVEAGFPMKILREQKTLSRLALAGQCKPA